MELTDTLGQYDAVQGEVTVPTLDSLLACGDTLLADSQVYEVDCKGHSRNGGHPPPPARIPAREKTGHPVFSAEMFNRRKGLTHRQHPSLPCQHLTIVITGNRP